MKQFIFTFIFCSIYTSLFAQELIDVIEFKNLLGGKSFVYAQDNKGLKTKDILEITKVDEAAYQEMKIAKRNYHLSTFVYLGSLGLLTATSLSEGYSENGKLKNHIELKIVAAGLLVAYLPLLLSGKKHKRNAVKIYNEGLKSTEVGMKKFKPKLGLADSGLGLKVSF